MVDGRRRWHPSAGRCRSRSRTLADHDRLLTMDDGRRDATRRYSGDNRWPTEMQTRPCRFLLLTDAMPPLGRAVPFFSSLSLFLGSLRARVILIMREYRTLKYCCRAIRCGYKSRTHYTAITEPVSADLGQPLRCVGTCDLGVGMLLALFFSMRN